MIRKKLLDTGYIEDNEALTKYIEIMNCPQTGGYVEKHHILPVSYFKLVGLPVDNSVDNLVSLSAFNHILAHYYLYRCVTNVRWKNKLATAFIFMKHGQQGHLLTLEENEFLKVLPYYSKLSYWKGRKRDRKSVGKSIETRMKNREIIYSKISASLSGRKHTEEAKEKMRLGQLRRDPSTIRRGFTLSEEQRARISETLKGHKQSAETKQKRIESLHKLKWFNNGIESIRCEKCPEGYVPGRLSFMTTEMKDKCSQKGKHWYTNGKINKMAFECPEGFWLGKIYRTRDTDDE